MVKPTKKQLAFIMYDGPEIFFGGSAGGGKSFGLILSALQYCDVPDYSAIIFRKTLQEHMKSDGVKAKLDELLSKFIRAKEVSYNGSLHTYFFDTIGKDGLPGNPARIELGYIGIGNAKIKYQGSAYQFIGWDEQTHHTETDFKYMFSRLRKPVCPIHKLIDGKPNYVDGCLLCEERKIVPLRVRSASNPGGEGHRWVKERYRIEPDISPEEAERTGRKVRWIGKHPSRPYLPSRLTDNDYLDQESYQRGLSELDEDTRKQLEEGDWGDSSTTKFRRQWFGRYSTNGDIHILGKDTVNQKGAYNLKEMRRIWLSVDSAASAKEGMLDQFLHQGEDPSWSVISVFALTPNWNVLWLDMDRFQEEVPEVIERVIRMWDRWNRWADYVLIEGVGTGLGVVQNCQRAGVPVTPVRATTDKVVRATNAIMYAKKGRIWLPQRASWLKDCEDELFSWQGYPKEQDDIIDTLSQAINDVPWPSNLDTYEHDYQGPVADQPAIGYVNPSQVDPFAHFPDIHGLQ